MKRSQINQLIQWKNDALRKPLIIHGARQVGKTWLMKEFGRQHFERTIYLNFEKSERLRNLFQEDFDLKRILLSIEIESGQKINPQNTLLIFDEIQEAERGLTALKYFYEEAPELYIMAAGSLLGITIHKKNSFPVGKVDFMKMGPLSFFEFLENLGEHNLLTALLEKDFKIMELFHEKLIGFLRTYYFIGGMPEAVKTFIETQDMKIVRSVHQKILTGYENDFSKYAPIEIVPRIQMVWNGVLSQLAKENRKFVYGQIKKGARAKDFEMAINWLLQAGLIVKVHRISKPAVPLKAYMDYDGFKIFLLDIGLLNTIGNVDPKILLEKNNILTEFKGAMTEQFVCQQLFINHDLYYWSAENATSEIDFVLQSGQSVVPIEVKAEENLKAKSLKVFVEKFKIQTAIRSSMSHYRKEEWLVNIPLYLAENCLDWV